MKTKALLVLAIFLGGLSLPFFSFAEEEQAAWRTSVLGSFSDKKITVETMVRVLLKLGYVEDRERVINETIIRKRMIERGVAVSVQEIDEAYKTYVQELIAQGEASSEQELLRLNRMTLDEVRESVRLRIGLKKMTMSDRKVTEEEAANAMPLWLEKQRMTTKILRFALDPDQPLENCAEVEGEKIPVERLIQEILRRMTDDEIDAFISEVMDFYLVEAYLEETGQALTKADLLDELKRVEEEVAEDPAFNGVPLVDILAAQKKTVESLMSEPGFVLRAMVRKACDSKYPITTEMERKHYIDNPAEFADREIIIRIISIYYKLTDGTPMENRTREQAKKLADEAMKQIVEGKKFIDVAATYAEDPGLKESGGKVGSPLKRSSTIFQFLPELLVLFEKELGVPVGPIETQYGFHIARVESIKDKPFEEVQAEVSKSLRRKIRKDWLEGLRAEKKMEHVKAADVIRLFFPALR
ncbi:MAG: hypothetical protein Kow00107_09800 [Planctomycetota bacterium]